MRATVRLAVPVPCATLRAWSAPVSQHLRQPRPAAQPPEPDWDQAAAEAPTVERDFAAGLRGRMVWRFSRHGLTDAFARLASLGNRLAAGVWCRVRQ